MNKERTVIIIGAGPAGLTAAYELLKGTDCRVIVLESSEYIGGISRTVEYKGNRMDIGGHRFFSKDERIMDWWLSFMPVQGAPAADDRILGREKAYAAAGPDPECSDTVMLVRDRVSRIYFNRHFFDYPISMKLDTFRNMGLGSTMKAGFSYMHSMVFKREERNLEDFMINRFGVQLYRMFFENYTEKVWGVHPTGISPEWGAQRIKSLSLTKMIVNLLAKPLRGNGIYQKNTETSLIEQFLYPKLGPGQLWETVAEAVRSMGGEIHMNCTVERLNMEAQRVISVECRTSEGVETFAGDVFLSSMAVKDLVRGIQGAPVPDEVGNAAAQLPYRDFMTAGLLLDRLNINNTTGIHTVGNIIPDCWIYVQDPGVKVGRLQVFNNWSPYLVRDYPDTVWVGMEYFCNENDELWNMEEPEFVRFAATELERLGVADSSAIRDGVCLKVKKAYPAYFGSYSRFADVRSYLDDIPNLYCIGRNGQHRYNNMDHSMLTAMEAVKNIRDGVDGKDNIWGVNTEEDYHESK